jgi:hypothetical protein
MHDEKINNIHWQEYPNSDYTDDHHQIIKTCFTWYTVGLAATQLVHGRRRNSHWRWWFRMVGAASSKRRCHVAGRNGMRRCDMVPGFRYGGILYAFGSGLCSTHFTTCHMGRNGLETPYMQFLTDVPKTPLKNTTEASYGRKSWLDLPFSLVTTHAGSKPRMTPAGNRISVLRG